MSLTEQVHEIGADEALVTEDSVRAARNALAREIARSRHPERARRTRRRWTGVGIGGLVAGAAATVIVVGSAVAPPQTPNAAAAVFEAAAESASDPVLSTGQYLAVATRGVQVLRWDTDAQSPVYDASEADGTFTVEQPVVRYVPADRDGADWVVERRQDTVTALWGDPAAVEQWEQLWASGVARVDRYPGGVGHVMKDGVEGDAYFIDGRDFYDGMPDDPAGIIDWWSARYADEQDDGGYAHFFIETVSDLGTFNLAPASIRSAMLDAFASIDGMEVVQVEGDRTTMRFDRGAKGDPSVLEFVLDTRRGYILSETDWGTADPDTATDPEDAPIWQGHTKASVTVVDSAP